MAIHRIRTTWTGSPLVGSGVSTFYAEAMASDALLTALKAFYTAIKGMVPTGVTWTVQSSGDIVNESDGTLAGSWSFPGGGGTVTSSGSPNFVNGVGARVKWRTNGIHGDRRVVGSTFIVPLDMLQYEGAGNIVSTTVTGLQAAANTLVTSSGGDWVIWSKPAKGGTDGEVNPVVAGTAPDLVSWLRSRRT
jgi:hypothetical protein